jgi:hypothetical protein
MTKKTISEWIEMDLQQRKEGNEMKEPYQFKTHRKMRMKMICGFCGATVLRNKRGNYYCPNVGKERQNTEQPQIPQTKEPVENVVQ